MKFDMNQLIEVFVNQLKVYRYNNRKQLLDHSMFFLMSEANLDKLSARCLMADYEPGETIVSIGQHPMDKLYLIVSGQVSVQQQKPSSAGKKCKKEGSSP